MCPYEEGSIVYYYLKKMTAVAIAVGAIAMLAVTPSDAEARRGFYRGPVYRAPAARYYRPAARAYYGRSVYRAGYRGYSPYRYGGRGVSIGAPGVGISIGF